MTEPVAPSREDAVVRGLSAGIGGPIGRRAAGSRRFWTVQRVMLALTCAAFALALLQKSPCHLTAWPRSEIDSWLCYSDVPHMYRERGFVDGNIPYLDTGDYPVLEYPVLIGLVMWLTAAIARTAMSVDAEAVRFFDVTALLMVASGIATVLTLLRLAGRRPWDVAMFALAPVLILSGLINWDLIAVALVTGALLAWSRRRTTLAGVLIGLGMATKLYPLFVLGPLLVLCLRTRQMADFRRTATATLITWAAVNLPVYLMAPGGWAEFWTFNNDRNGDFGSIFYVLELIGRPVPDGLLDALIFAIFASACIGIAWLGLTASRRPRLASLAFLVVAAFLLVNKVYSPQYALWLLPFAVLARPRWRDFLIWQAAEVVYWVAVWLHLSGFLMGGRAVHFYNGAVLLHVGATLWLCWLVVRDIRRPELDPVRQTGDDDPAFPWAAPDAGAAARRLATDSADPAPAELLDAPDWSMAERRPT